MATNRDTYFAKFPIISYIGAPAIDIIKRVDFNSNVQGFLSAFYPLSVDEGTRIDNLSFDYYDSPDYDWLIYHSNGMIDPYHDVNLSLSDFDQHIRAKYGSVRNAQRKVVWFETNASTDDTMLSLSAYNALTSDLRKYWDPVPGPAGPMGYQRSQETLYSSTNQIIRLVTDSVVGEFRVGENIERDGSTYGELTSHSNDEMIVQHINGNFEVTSPYTVSGDQSGATARVTAMSVISDVIPDDERVYYRAVTAYELEASNNEDRREVYLVDRVYRDRLNTQLEELLQ